MNRPDAAPDSNPAARSPTAGFVAADGIRVLGFDAETVVFNPVSWDAHLLNDAAAAVLELLTGGPRTFADVEQFLHEALVESERGDAAAHAQRLLGELQQLGLIRARGETPLARV